MATKLLKRLRSRKTAQPRSLSPMEKVTQTYELLEHILGYLNPHELRQAHLVNTYWHSIIHDSSILAELSKETKTYHMVRTMLVGIGGSGKNHLASSFASGFFIDQYDPTGDSSFRKAMAVDGENWLVEGDSNCRIGPDSYTSLLGQMLANSEVYVPVYSASSRDGFDELKAWVKQMNSPMEPLSMVVETALANRKKGYRGRRNGMRLERCIPAAVISTKNDLPADLKVVGPCEGAAFARELGCPFIETSAKTGAGVQEAFAEVCRVYKKARVTELSKRSRRTSLLGGAHTPAPETKERRARWWSWYRAKHHKA